MKEQSLYFDNISKVLLNRKYLRYPEFYSICMWKTHRQKPNYLNNSVEDIEAITKKVIIDSLSLEESIKALRKLEGVEVPVASAILTMIFPKKYCVFDFRVWEAFLWLIKIINSSILESYEDYANFLGIFKKSNNLNNYIFFHKVISDVADIYKKTPRQIEMALWKFDKEKGII